MPRNSLKPSQCEYCESRRFVRRTVDKMHRHRGQYYLVRGVPVVVCLGCGARYWPGSVLRDIVASIDKRGRGREQLSVPVVQLTAA